jgi:lipopolysaccharide biosynthesis glycosyltransferase
VAGDNHINVAYVVNDDTMWQTLVSALSAVNEANKWDAVGDVENFLHFYLICPNAVAQSDIPANVQEAFSSLAGAHSAVSLVPAKKIAETRAALSPGQISASLLKMYLPDILPNVPRVLCLSENVLCVGDIRDLWDFNLRCFYLATLPHTGDDRCNNDQVILMDLSKMRQYRFTRDVNTAAIAMKKNPSVADVIRGVVPYNRHGTLPSDVSICVSDVAAHHSAHPFQMESCQDCTIGPKTCLIVFSSVNKPWMFGGDGQLLEQYVPQVTTEGEGPSDVPAEHRLPERDPRWGRHSPVALAETWPFERCLLDRWLDTSAQAQSWQEVLEAQSSGGNLMSMYANSHFEPPHWRANFAHAKLLHAS